MLLPFLSKQAHYWKNHHFFSSRIEPFDPIHHYILQWMCILHVRAAFKGGGARGVIPPLGLADS